MTREKFKLMAQVEKHLLGFDVLDCSVRHTTQ